ncbi:MAG: ACT domain-containing protein [Acidobacteria bacterium]|nr:ACT domain-containing protein [Acidobacteriota bacterium]
MVSYTPVPRTLRFSLLPGRFAVCRLEPDAPVPPWAAGSPLVSITRTAEELSIVCAEDHVPADARATRGFCCLKLLGPFALEETGVLLAFIAPLAERNIPVFAVSTYDTDYVLLPASHLDAALDALRSARHQLL